MTTRMCFQASLLVCAVALFVAVQPLALAQVTTGRIVGVVTDPSGSRVPGVTVTITEVADANGDHSDHRR